MTTEPERFRYEDGILWVGERPIPYVKPADHHGVDVDLGSGLGCHHSRAVRVMLENGWYISTIWGDATYSDNHWSTGSMVFGEGTRGENFVEEPSCVEVAVCNDGGLVEWEDQDTVQGYVKPEEFLRLIAYVATWPSNRQGPYSLLWRDRRESD